MWHSSTATQGDVKVMLWSQQSLENLSPIFISSSMAINDYLKAKRFRCLYRSRLNCKSDLTKLAYRLKNMLQV